MEKKMTYVDAINFAVENINDVEVIEKLQTLKESIAKRNAHKSTKPTKKQVANEALKDAILEAMADGGKYTITDLTEKVAGLEDASPQKVSALLTQMKKAEVVKREEIKRKAYFSVA